MNDINTILEAVGELDNTVLENAFDPKRKRHIMLTTIAAAAAFSLLAGFTTAVRNHVEFNGKPVFDYNLKYFANVKIPPFEEMEAMGADSYYEIVGLSEAEIGYSYFIDAAPGAVIKKYGVEPLINDNFSEYVDANDPRRNRWGDFPRMQVTIVSVDRADIPSCIYFDYWLTDKQSGLPVHFMADCYIDSTESIIHRFSGSTDDCELVALKNEKKAFIQHGINTETGAYEVYSTFTYNGIVYNIDAATDIDGMKQILADLGITVE